MKNILIVPSFMADTYSNIEKIYVQMSEDLKDEFNFIWLIRNPDSHYERYKDPTLRGNLKKSLYATLLEEKGITVLTEEISKWNWFSNWRLFQRIFEQHSIDGVYAHFHFEKYPVCFFGKLFGKKVIYNEHMYIDLDNINIKNKLRIGFLNHFSDTVIAVSKHTSKAFNPDKCHLIYNALNLNDISLQDKNASKRRLGYDLDQINILMVAAFRPEKRHDFAFQIAKQLLQAEKNIVFTFVGDGELLEKYQKDPLVRRYPNQIKFSGHVSNIADYYNAADISIMTSQGESFGYAIAESMAYQLPVIAFLGSGGPDELLTDGIHGYLVKNHDLSDFSSKIQSLIQDNTLRETMGKNGRQRIQQDFNYETWLQTIREVFRLTLK